MDDHDAVYDIIAHEFTHMHHGHSYMTTQTAREEIQLEIEADATAERWGFDAESAIRLALLQRDEILNDLPTRVELKLDLRT